MSEDQGPIGAVTRFLGGYRESYRLLKAKVSAPVAIAIMGTAAFIVVWWNWPDISERPGVQGVVEALMPAPDLIPALGKLNIVVASFEGDTADRQRRAFVVEALRGFSAVEVHTLDKTFRTERDAANAAHDLCEDLGPVVLVSGHLTKEDGRRLIALHWVACPVPPLQLAETGFLPREDLLKLPALSPEHLARILPVIVHARIVDAAATLSEHHRTANTFAAIAAARQLLDAKPAEWDAETLAQMQNVLANALYIAERRDPQASAIREEELDLDAKRQLLSSAYWAEPLQPTSGRRADLLARMGLEALRRPDRLFAKRWIGPEDVAAEIASIPSKKVFDANAPKPFPPTTTSLTGPSGPCERGHGMIAISDDLSWGLPTYPPPNAPARFADVLRDYEAAISSGSAEQALSKLQEPLVALLKEQALARYLHRPIGTKTRLTPREERMRALISSVVKCESALRPTDLRSPFDLAAGRDPAPRPSSNAVSTFVLGLMERELARQRIEDALVIYQRLVAGTNRNSIDLGVTQNNFGVLLEREGRLGEAEAAFGTAHDIFSGFFVSDPTRAAVARENLGRVRDEQKRRAELTE